MAKKVPKLKNLKVNINTIDSPQIPLLWIQHSETTLAIAKSSPGRQRQFLETFFRWADLLSDKLNISFTRKLDDFEALYWDFLYRAHRLLYPSTFLTVSPFFPSLGRAQWVFWNAAIAELVDLLKDADPETVLKLVYCLVDHSFVAESIPMCWPCEWVNPSVFLLINWIQNITVADVTIHVYGFVAYRLLLWHSRVRSCVQTIIEPDIPVIAPAFRGNNEIVPVLDISTSPNSFTR